MHEDYKLALMDLDIPRVNEYEVREAFHFGDLNVPPMPREELQNALREMAKGTASVKKMVSCLKLK